MFEGGRSAIIVYFNGLKQRWRSLSRPNLRKKLIVVGQGLFHVLFSGLEKGLDFWGHRAKLAKSALVAGLAKLAGRTRSTPVTPRMPMSAVSLVTGMGLFGDELAGASAIGVAPELGFVPVQKWSQHFNRAVKGLGKSRLSRCHERPSAIGIPTIVHLASANNQASFSARVAPYSGYDQKKQVASRHEGGGKPIGGDLDRFFCRERRGHLPLGPEGTQLQHCMGNAQQLGYTMSTSKLHKVPLSIRERKRPQRLF